MKIRTKISLWYAGLLTLIIIIFSVAVFGVIQATILNSIDNSLAQTSVNILRDIRVIPVGEFSAPEIHVVFRSDEVFRIPELSLQVWQTSDGESAIEPTLIRASYDLQGFDGMLDGQYLASGEPVFSNVTLSKTPGRVLTLPFATANGQQIGVIQIAASTLIVQQVTAGVLKVMLLATGLGIVISIMVGMMLSYSALKPIEEISKAAAGISTSDDLTTRLPETGLADDEIGRLTRVFNHMMARLEYLFGVQQRFVADLSHELRTPLTAIQGNLDMVKRYGADETSLEAIQQETARMTRMVNEVLLLARADYGDIQIDLYPLDLDTLMLDVLNTAPALAHHRDLKFEVGRHENVHINGNYERLLQVVSNLMMNAIKFTNDGGKITLSVYQDGNSGVLEVADTGIGISKENLDRIFDRFYQVDNSRAHTSDHDGSGLGLSIVKWIVEAHGGTIEVSSKVKSGTTFRIRLPILAQEKHHPAQRRHDSSAYQNNQLRGLKQSLSERKN